MKAEDAPTPAPLPGDKISSFPISDKGAGYKAPAACFGLTQILKEMCGVCLLELQPGPPGGNGGNSGIELKRKRKL